MFVIEFNWSQCFHSLVYISASTLLKTTVVSICSACSHPKDLLFCSGSRAFVLSKSTFRPSAFIIHLLLNTISAHFFNSIARTSILASFHNRVIHHGFTGIPSSMNRLCVFFRFLLPGGPIMYPSDCSMSIVTGTSVRQNPTGEKLSFWINPLCMLIHLLVSFSFSVTSSLVFHLHISCSIIFTTLSENSPVYDCHSVVMNLVISLLIVIIGYHQIPFVVPNL